MSHEEQPRSTDERPERQPRVSEDQRHPFRLRPAYAAAGVPMAGLAAGENPPPAGPGLGNLVGDVVTHWPLGGVGGFTVMALAGAGLGVLHLKQRWESGSASVKAGRAGEGFATSRELNKMLGGRQLRKRAATLRPSLAGVPSRGLSPLELGLYLGQDKFHRRDLYVSCEDLLLVVAPPRSGKTALLGNHVIDAPGPVLATSTRADLYEATHGLRRAGNRPVWVFNAGLEGVQNTVRWNLVAGCEDPETAVRRAGFILSAGASGDDLDHGKFWDINSFKLLRSFLMAGALAGKNLMDIRRWITDPTSREALEILRTHKGRVPDGWYNDLEQAITAPDRTRDGIFLSLGTSVEFLSLPAVADIVLPRPGEPHFTPEEFVRSNGTLYLMGRHRTYGSIAPLFTALVGEVFEAARVEAARKGGRMDPYLRMVLDEAALICPLPLHQWSADAGGWGIQLEISVQSPSQLYERWGLRGGQTLWQNTNKLVMGGLSVPEDLESLSMLCGERDEETISSSTSEGSDKVTRTSSFRRVRVMPPDKIRTLEPGAGLYFHRSGQPVLLSFGPVWERKDVKALAKAAKKQARADARAAKNGKVVATYVPPMPEYAPTVPPQQAPASAEETGRREVSA